jgi:hypothetical protein
MLISYSGIQQPVSDPFDSSPPLFIHVTTSAMAMGSNQATTMFYDTNQLTIHGGQFTQNATYVGQPGNGE